MPVYRVDSDDLHQSVRNIEANGEIIVSATNDGPGKLLIFTQRPGRQMVTRDVGDVAASA